MDNLDNDIESTESDVLPSASSDASESSSESSAPAPAQADATAESQKVDSTPFHEHPRFKELVEQKNEALKNYQSMQDRFKSLEQQLSSFKDSQPKPPSEFDTLIKDLKQVDPRLAAALEANMKSSEQAKALQERLDNFEKQSHEQKAQSALTNAVSKINSMHELNKLPDFAKSVINNQLDLAYRSQKLNPSDLKGIETAYNEALKGFKSFEETFKRSVTEGYVKDKAKDSSVPTSQPKGTPAKATQKAPPTFKDKDALRSAVVKSYLKDQAASRDAVNV